MGVSLPTRPVTRGQGFAVLLLGRLDALRGDQATAKLDLQQALDMTRRQGDPFRTALAVDGPGQVAIAGAEHEEAQACLVLSVRAVERHITNLHGKIDARGKADATAYAIRHGFV